jgi:hypothetical protein
MTSQMSAHEGNRASEPLPPVVGEVALNVGSNEPVAARLLARSEGRILVAGIAAMVVFAVWLTLQAIHAPEQSHALLGFSILALFAGRPAAILFAHSMKLPFFVILTVPAAVETIVVLIFYPLFAFSCQRLVTFKSLQKAFRRLTKTAETHEAKIRQYGPSGLFVLSLVLPFGPLVGSIAGFLLRMPTWLTMTTVLSATYLAIFVLALLLGRVNSYVSSYGPGATGVMVIIVIAIAILRDILRRRAEKDR